MDCSIGPAAGPASRTLRLRTSGSAFSQPATFAIDAPQDRPAAAEFSGPLEIQGLADGTTWEDNLVRLDRGNCVSLWVRGLPEDATRTRMGVRLGDADSQVLFVSAPDARGLRQINVRLPAQLAPGDYDVVVVYGTSVTGPRPLCVHR
jgi:uncharacterized protein (TIGR03437 family)